MNLTLKCGDAVYSATDITVAGQSVGFDSHAYFAIQDEKMKTVATLSVLPYLFENEFETGCRLGLIIDRFEMRRECAEGTMGTDLLNEFAQKVRYVFDSSRVNVLAIVPDNNARQVLLDTRVWDPVFSIPSLEGIALSWSSIRAYRPAYGLLSFHANSIQPKSDRLLVFCYLQPNAGHPHSYYAVLEYVAGDSTERLPLLPLKVLASLKEGKMCFTVDYSPKDEHRKLEEVPGYATAVADAVTELAQNYRGERSQVVFDPPDRDTAKALLAMGWQEYQGTYLAYRPGEECNG